MSRKYDTCPLCGATKDARAKRCKSCFYKTRPMTPIERRFWKHVDRRGPGECWPWLGFLSASGYGRLREGGRNGQMWMAHRFSYVLHFGPIPDGDGYHGLCVCHRCDNPRCVNPAHLFLGTFQDNVDDRVRKDRSARVTGLANGAHTHPEKVARGSSHYAAKLTDEQVKAIRAVKPAERVHETADQIAAQYGISHSHVIKLWYGYKWKHL